MGKSYRLASTTIKAVERSTGPMLTWGFGLAATLARTPNMSKPLTL